MTAAEARVLTKAAEHSMFREELRLITKAAKRGNRSIDLLIPAGKMRLTLFLRELGYTVDPFFSSDRVKVSW